MKEHPHFPWDHYSDQPEILHNKKLKRQIYLKSALHFLKSIFLLPLLPIFLVLLFFKKKWNTEKVNRCIGLSVHVETEASGKTIVPLNQLVEQVQELDIKQLLVRIPLSDSHNIDTYIEHIEALSKDDREITVNLLQDRLNLDNQDTLRENLEIVIGALKGKVTYIHVGNAFNRRKWAFLNFGEYHNFFQTIRSVSNQLAPEIKLIGGSVIDFEILAFLESLFHFRKGDYDGYGAQLYVDRRGAPENTQLGCNLLKKINLIHLMQLSSWKVRGSLWITEINWPLLKTGRFAPCDGEMLVDEQTQADYLTRTYLIAIASGNIRTCYWHQLVAPGYGLVDNRTEPALKRPSFYAMKTLIQLFDDAEILHFNDGNYSHINGLYSLKAKTIFNGEMTIIQAFWSNSGEHQIELPKAHTWLSQQGEQIQLEQTSKNSINSSVKYALMNESSS